MTKLRIRVGAIELDYDGDDEFLKVNVPDLLQTIIDMRAAAGLVSEEDETVVSPTGVSAGNTPSTSTIAAAMGAKSGGDLALAAAVALVAGGKESFSRAELLSAMQAAKAYYKATFRSNLSSYISTLVKSRDFLDHGNDRFGLRDEKRQELI